MKTINFIGSGLMGDFINGLCACKNICKKEKAKANLYIANGWLGDPFRYGVQKAYDDTYELILFQDYINSYQILPIGFSEEIINLNLWRNEVHTTYKNTGKYNKCWSELLSETFDYPIGEYKWLSLPPIDVNTIDRIVIHRSRQRHNHAYPEFIKAQKEKMIFLTTNIEEYEKYEFKELVEPYVVSTISQMALAIRSCKLFIGNQSSPFAIASALDVNRVVELCNVDAAPFYIGEEKYSNKIKLLME